MAIRVAVNKVALEKHGRIGIQGCGIEGFIPTSVIQGNLPRCVGGSSLGSPLSGITEVVISNSIV